MLNIARNLAVDATRSKHQKIKTNIQTTIESVYEKNAMFVENTTHENIDFKNILNNLKEDHQTIIDLACFEGYAQEEISKKLNIPLDNVKQK